jgi:hypothetical protein
MPQQAEQEVPAVHRTGVGTIELMAVWRIMRESAAIPASIIVQMALWPVRLSDWAAAEGIEPSVVYNMLAGTKPYRKTRRRLARRLGVEPEAVDALIEHKPIAAATPDTHAPAGFREMVQLVHQGELFGSAQPDLPMRVQLPKRSDVRRHRRERLQPAQMSINL